VYLLVFAIAVILSPIPLSIPSPTTLGPNQYVVATEKVATAMDLQDPVTPLQISIWFCGPQTSI